MELQKFKDFISDVVLPEITNDYYDFEGDIIDLEDREKDELCFVWLSTMKSWRDDILPPVITNPDHFLEVVYNNNNVSDAMLAYRNDIYLYLEPTLREIIAELWADYTNQKPEPFAGYERGE